MSNQNNGAMVESPLNLKEAAAFLRIQPGTLYQWCCKKLIRYYKPNNGRLLFKRRDLEEFVFNERNLVLTKEDANNLASQQLLRE